MRNEWAALRGRREISVLIAGGGINGAGLMWELALQGVDVLLVDKADFSAGTSAASTRVIHGGLRYLENAEFRLVREAVRERNLLLKNAAHYVKPLPTTIPIFSWASGILPAVRNFLGSKTKPGDRGALLIKIGLSMYDRVAGSRSPLPKHRFRSRAAALALRPALNPAIVCTATYYDARITYPERLCMELALDAERLCPQARALNYVRVAGASDGTVVLRDEITGETCEVRPRVVVNATGAWIDFTNRSLGRESAFIGGTKGSHVVVDLPELLAATRGEMLYFANRDGRICIFYQFYDKVIAGATDIPTDDPEAICDEDEVTYILESIRQVFPSIRVDRSHVVFQFCGVRPLPRSNALTPGQISRDHSAPVLAPGNGIDFPVYSLVGGKLTTFRAFAEQVGNRILRDLGRARVRDSAGVAIGGGRDYPRSGAELEQWRIALAQRAGFTTRRIDDLLDRYGSRAGEFADFLEGRADEPLRHNAGYSRREIEFMAAREKVTRLEDIILRRTLMGMLGQVTGALLRELAGIVAPVLGWTPEREAEEVERTAHVLERVYGVRPERLNP